MSRHEAGRLVGLLNKIAADLEAQMPDEAIRLMGHPDIVERLDDLIGWVDGNRACIWVEKDIADLRDARAEISRLRTALRAVRACTDPAWQAQLIAEALRETP